MRNESTDRRSRRTQRLLGQALLNLIQERPFEKITVQDILTRADVGRSTFYQHYSGKEDLLLSEVLERLMGTPAPQGGPPHDLSQECVGLFRQIREQMQVLRVILGGQGSPLLLKHFQDLLTGIFEQGLRHDSPLPGIPLALQGRFVAQTFVLVLQWWAEQRFQPSPQEVERLFLTLVMPARR